MSSGERARACAQGRHEARIVDRVATCVHCGWVCPMPVRFAAVAADDYVFLASEEPPINPETGDYIAVIKP